MSKQILNVIWIVLLFNGLCLFGFGQETTALEDEVKEAEARAKIAKAEREALENKFPAPDANALKATNSVEGVPIESTLQAYNSFRTISTKIAADAQTKGVRNLYVYRADDFKKIIDYKNLLNQVDVINAEYGRCFEGAAGGLAIPPGVLASIFLKWLPLLKTDTTIKAKDITIEDEAVWAILADSLKGKNIELHNPFISPYEFIDLGGMPAPVLVRKLERAEVFRQTANCTNAAYLFKPQINAAFDKLKADLGLTLAGASPSKKVTTTTTIDTPPTKRVEETIENTAASAATEIKFWDFARTEKIITAMENTDAFWLVIKNVKAGGNMRIKTNPLIDVFRGGSSIKFSGGSVAYYYILDNDGKIVLSNVGNGYAPYTKSSKIQ